METVSQLTSYTREERLDAAPSAAIPDYPVARGLADKLCIVSLVSDVLTVLYQ